MFSQDQAFFDLPMAMVDELLRSCDIVGDGLYKGFKEILEQRKSIREKLRDQGLLLKDSEIIEDLRTRFTFRSSDYWNYFIKSNITRWRAREL